MNTSRTYLAGLVLLVAAIGAAIPAAEQALFVETFEDRATGYLDEQHDWDAAPSEIVQVQTEVVHGGSRAGVMADGSSLSQSFTNAAVTNVWVDFCIRLQHPSHTNPPV